MIELVDWYDFIATNVGITTTALASYYYLATSGAGILARTTIGLSS
jgi:hypothetical protein